MPNVNDPTPPFELTEGEKQNPLWKRLEEHFGERLEHFRSRNDGPLDPVQTANMRGRIETYRDLLALGKE